MLSPWVPELVCHPNHGDGEEQRRTINRFCSREVVEHASTVSDIDGLAFRQRGSSRNRVSGFRSTKCNIIRIVFCVVPAARERVEIGICRNANTVQAAIGRSQLVIDETVSVSRVTNAGSVDTDAAITTRGLLLSRRVGRADWNGAVKSGVRGAAVHGEALAPSVPESVGAIVVAHPVAVAVVQAVVLTAGRSRSRELTFTLTSVPVACPAVVTLIAHLLMSEVIKDTDVCRTRDVRTVQARETLVANAEVVFAHAASRAIFRARRWEVLP